MGSIAATQMRGDRERRRHCLYDALEKGEERERKAYAVWHENDLKREKRIRENEKIIYLSVIMLTEYINYEK